MERMALGDRANRPRSKGKGSRAGATASGAGERDDDPGLAIVLPAADDPLSGLPLVPPFDLEDYRELRQALFSLRDTAYYTLPRRAETIDGPAPGGYHDGHYYVCRHCYGTGPWPSQVGHLTHDRQSGGRECRVVRAERLLARLIAFIDGQERRAVASPVDGGP
jgi:hypothetical protein